MPIPEDQQTTVMTSKNVTRMLFIVRGRAAAAGNAMSYHEILEYMIETLYSDVYRHVMYGEPLKNGTDSEY